MWFPQLRHFLTPLIAIFSVSLLLMASGCSPGLDWRQVMPAQADGLQAWFPCKPDMHERQLVLAGMSAPVQMRLLSCQTGEDTWALSYFTATDAASVPQALNEMAASMQRNLAAASQLAGGPAEVTARKLGGMTVPHMTPQANSQAWRLEALRPDGLGRPLRVQVTAWHFSHGMTVFQASVSRPIEAVKAQSSEDLTSPFFSGFQFPG
jgi:hypothetical protein